MNVPMCREKLPELFEVFRNSFIQYEDKTTRLSVKDCGNGVAATCASANNGWSSVSGHSLFGDESSYSKLVSINQKQYGISVWRTVMSFDGFQAIHLVYLKEGATKTLAMAALRCDDTLHGDYKDLAALTMLKGAIAMATGKQVKVFVDVPYVKTLLGYEYARSVEEVEVSSL